ncbi:PAS domain S-box-containing protein/diguanylate cyclase (GGDEF) domain-containing protein [Thiohalospira halophila DSM 15071]|uniref:cyclic-guanylate-specific phosphodiesterase n=2 Tax=Thiohalospira halophila TaxID=381300 RepID=A0A1I1NTD7_9GAMM|nr:PAS domain S-box-containing protein/diguanylate cyclase (GGDEF) domain-containing protein [Thiohalospira halophila DSM 15071]
MTAEVVPPEVTSEIGHSLMAEGPDAVIILGPDQRIRRFNRAAEEIFGFRESEMVGAPLDDLLLPEQTRQHGAYLDALAQQETAVMRMGERGHINARHRDGRTITLDATVGVLRHQESPWFFAFLRDITAQAQAEADLRHQRDLYHAISASNRLLIRNPVPDDAYSEICRIIVRLGGLGLAWIGLPSENGDFRPVAAFGEAADYVRNIRVTADPEQSEGRGPGGRVLREDQPVLIPDIQAEPTMAPWQEAARAHGLASVGGFPIRRGGSVAGVLLVYGRERDFFTPERVNLLEELAADLGAALDHYDQLQSNYRLLEILEATPDFVAIAEPEGRITYANPATRAGLGFDPVGHGIDTIHPDPSRRRLREEALPTARREGRWQGEIDVRVRGGREVHSFSQVIIAHSPEPGGEPSHYSTIARDIHDLKEAEARIEELSYRDRVTGLPNRTALRERLVEESRRLSRTGRQGAVVHLDLDGFKGINDTLGTEVGDGVLCAVGLRLRGQVRTEDVVAHIGADEFVVLLLDLEGTPEAAATAADRLAERMREEFSIPLKVEGRRHRLKASFGITLFPRADHDPDQLLRETDIALDPVKARGGDDIAFFQPGMLATTQRELELEQALADALDGGDIQVVYQPQWDLASGRMVGMEALARWEHPERGAISPAEFVPLAERSGLINRLGDSVLEQVLTQLREWEAAGYAIPPMGVAVNISPRQFAALDWEAGIHERLRRFGVAGDRLKLEVTESLLMENLATAADKLARLRAEGICFALDDFGTGYSSLAYLQELPLDYVKIDRSFVQRIGDGDAGEGIIEAVLAMASHLGLDVIAEGVETEAQADFLRSRNCDAGQGFLWARPLPPAEVAALLP